MNLPRSRFKEDKNSQNWSQNVTYCFFSKTAHTHIHTETDKDRQTDKDTNTMVHTSFSVMWRTTSTSVLLSVPVPVFVPLFITLPLSLSVAFLPRFTLFRVSSPADTSSHGYFKALLLLLRLLSHNLQHQ